MKDKPDFSLPTVSKKEAKSKMSEVSDDLWASGMDAMENALFRMARLGRKTLTPGDLESYVQIELKSLSTLLYKAYEMSDKKHTEERERVAITAAKKG